MNTDAVGISFGGGQDARIRYDGTNLFIQPRIVGTGDAVVLGAVGLQEITTPAALANYGKIYTKTDNQLYFQDGAGTEHIVGGHPELHSYTAHTQGLGASPDIYVAGHYDAPAAAVALNQANLTQTYGTANKCEGAHAFLVAAAAGTATGGAGAVTIKVTGISIASDGTRNAADTEVLIADITSLSTDDYVETEKRWLGQVTFTIDPGATGHTAYALTFNYGFACDAACGSAGVINSIRATGLAGANDDNFDIILYKHSSTGWTYNNGAFVPGGTILAQLSTDCSTDDKLVASEQFAWSHSGLATAYTVNEGFVVKLTSTANNAIEYCNIQVKVTI